MKKALGIFILLVLFLATLILLIVIQTRQQVQACEEAQQRARVLIEAGEIVIDQSETTTTTVGETTPYDELSPEELLEIDCETYVMDNLSLGNLSATPSISRGSAIAPDGSNGRLDDGQLMLVSSHGSYECRLATVENAAQLWLQLVDAAREDGVDIEGGWCYRTYETQFRIWTERGCANVSNCDGSPYPPTAYPGTSNHGWGTAVDIWNRWDVTLSCLDPEYAWLLENAASFGWTQPSWALCGRGSQEPWHWEFTGLLSPIADSLRGTSADE